MNYVSLVVGACQLIRARDVSVRELSKFVSNLGNATSKLKQNNEVNCLLFISGYTCHCASVTTNYLEKLGSGRSSKFWCQNGES